MSVLLSNAQLIMHVSFYKGMVIFTRLTKEDSFSIDGLSNIKMKEKYHLKEKKKCM